MRWRPCRVMLAITISLLSVALARPAVPSARAQTGPSLTLAPAAGPAGTTVTVSGFVDGVSADAAAAPDQTASNAFVCWDRCPGGLTFESVAVRWATDDPGAFTLSFTVPATPWLEADGVHQPAPGVYTVGVQCLTPPGMRLVGGCATMPAVANASFTLTGDAPPACSTANCTTLQLTPAEAAPGTLVQVSGSAPLAQHLINGGACCWDLVLATSAAAPAEIAPLQQTSDGAISGSFRAPLALSDTGPLAAGPYLLALRTSIDGETGAAAGTALVNAPTLAIVSNGPNSAEAMLSGALFTLDAAQPWSSLSSTVPLAVLPSTPLSGSSVTADEGSPARVAACVAGGVLISGDGGATWNELPTDGVSQAITAAGYDLFAASGPAAPTPSCVAALLDAAHPSSVFVTFQAAKQRYGAPPVFNLGLVSTDAGATWQLVPPPEGDAPDSFGGFFAAPSGIEALFSAPNAAMADAGDVALETTSDGGLTWSADSLDCPAAGPCVRWGAAANARGSCAMHAYPQPLLVSLDSGATFAQPTWPVAANGCAANELVALSPTNVLLLSGQDDFPAVISTDGGASWRALALPPLPSTATGGARYPDLQILSTGGLLARGDSGWYLLPTRATGWCQVDPSLLPAGAMDVQAAGDTLWWFSAGESDAGPLPPTALDAAEIGCTAN